MLSCKAILRHKILAKLQALAMTVKLVDFCDSVAMLNGGYKVSRKCHLNFLY